MTKPKKKPRAIQKYYAFWKYDLFPYLLSGTIKNIDDEGFVETREYGKGYSFKPIKILPYKDGIKIANELNDITHRYNVESEKIHIEYQDKVKQITKF